MLANASPLSSVAENSFHEFYADNFEPRSHYRLLWEHIRRIGQGGLAQKSREAHLALNTEGVTFTVYSEQSEGIERVLPFDVIPRIIPPLNGPFWRKGSSSGSRRSTSSSKISITNKES